LISSDQFDPAGHDPEVLIVGAGAVGIVLGVALAKAGRRVLLAEGGPAKPPLDYRRRNAGPNTGVRHEGLADGRMKALGGTTRLWGGQLVPFGPCDFAPTYAGKPPWPIGRDMLDPYFERVLDLLQVPRSIRDPGALWQQLGRRPFDLGPNFEWTMNAWLPVADFTRLFGAELASLPGLEVVTDLEAVALDFAEDGRVAAVRMRKTMGEEIRLAAAEVVLANGTMEIVRLLLHAAAGSPNCPFAGNPHVGRGFIDHLHGIVGRVLPSDLGKLRASVENVHLGGRKYSMKIRASDSFLRREGLANCAATFNAAGSLRQSLGDLRELARRLFAGGAGGASPGAVIAEAGRTLATLAPVVWNYLVRRRC
jgi:hypothetical protein